MLGQIYSPRKSVPDVKHKLGQNQLERGRSLAGQAGRYLEIAADLRTRILGGSGSPGAKLPRMADLARIRRQPRHGGTGDRHA